jgi:hypothetical protein
MGDPDMLLAREGILLLNKLIELNSIVGTMPERGHIFWIDEPSPQRGLELEARK